VALGDRGVKAIDLFAGLGGFSEGARQAGLEVVWAANHWPEAVATHQRNHPSTVHALEDLVRIDWTRVPAHDVLLASPACQGHSRARDRDRPYHDGMRATAWAVTSALEFHRPTSFVVENVPEFQAWELFDLWLATLERLGYRVTRQVLDASAFGVPQSRERLFLVGHRRHAIPVVAPALPRARAYDVIDWTGAATWRHVEVPGRSPLVLRQWRNGRPIHGDRFLVGYHSDKRRGVSLDGPIGTLTTKDQWAVVDGDRCRMLTVAEYAAFMGFPAGYHRPRRRDDAIKAIGNAVCPPVAREVIRQVLAVA
jgi:DNA (cytosine-5)-methyltransferase 1